VSLNFLALLHDWLKFTKPTGEFEFNSLQKSVNCEPNLFSVSPPVAAERRGVLDDLACSLATGANHGFDLSMSAAITDTQRLAFQSRYRPSHLPKLHRAESVSDR
jgi:hypothetical protein